MQSNFIEMLNWSLKPLVEHVLRHNECKKVYIIASYDEGATENPVGVSYG